MVRVWLKKLWAVPPVIVKGYWTIILNINRPERSIPYYAKTGGRQRLYLVAYALYLEHNNGRFEFMSLIPSTKCQPSPHGAST